jgi:hypothetical protein
VAGTGNIANLTNAGKGRQKGVPNKATKLLKEQILESLDAEGGVLYIRKLAQEQPVAFASLLGKILPTQISGEGGGPVLIITGVPRDAAD